MINQKNLSYIKHKGPFLSSQGVTALNKLQIRRVGSLVVIVCGVGLVVLSILAPSTSFDFFEKVKDFALGVAFIIWGLFLRKNPSK